MNEREKYAYDFYLKKGWSPQAASGIVGNLLNETGRRLDPTIIHDAGTGLGLAGWRDPEPGKGRRTNLRNFASARGKPAEDFDVQLEFLDHELRTSEAGVGTRLRTAQTPEEAAHIFVDFERPSGWKAGDPTNASGYGNRLKDAQRLHASYTGVDIQPSDRSPTRPITVPEQMASDTAASAPPGPGGNAKVIGAAINEHSFSAWLADKTWLLPDDPDYELTSDRLKVLTKGLPQDRWSAFENAHSAAQAEDIRRQLHEQMDRQRTIAEAGITGALASFAVAIGDPVGLGVGLVSGGVGNALMWGSKLNRLQRVALSGVAGAGINAGLTAAEESLKPLPEWDAVLYSAVGGAAMGAGFGALSKMSNMAEEADILFKQAKAGVEEVEARYGVAPIRPKDTSVGAAQGIEQVPLSEGANDYVRLADGTNAPRTAMGGVLRALETTGPMKSSENPLTRMLGNALGEDGTGNLDREIPALWSASQEQARVFQVMDTRRAVAIEPHFKAWAEARNLGWRDRFTAREEFQTEVSRARRNMDPTRTFDPHVMKAVGEVAKWFDDYHALAVDPGAAAGLSGKRLPVPGFDPSTAPVKNYVNRVFSYRKVDDNLAKYGHAALGDAVAAAMRQLNPDLDPARLAKLGRGYVKKVRALSRDPMLRGSNAMFSDDLEGLRGFLGDFDGLTPEDVEHIMSEMSRPLDKGTVSRAKRRVMLDESLRLEMPDGTVTTFAELFLEEDIGKLMARYNRDMSGQVALAQVWVEKVIDGERHVLIDGLAGPGKLDNMLQKIAHVGDEIGQPQSKVMKDVRQIEYLHKSTAGVPLYDQSTQWAQALRLVREYGVVRVMGQVGFAQFPEIGAIYSAGFKAAYAGMPSFRALLRDARTGQLKDEFAAELEAVFARGAERIRSAGDWSMSTEAEWGTAFETSPRMQKVEKGLGVAKRITMEVSGLNAINTLLHRWSTSAVLHWFSRAASGEASTSVQRLRSMGLTDDMAERVMGQMRQYRTLKEGSSFKLARLNLDNWDDLEAAAHFERAVHARGSRMVQTNSPGLFAPWMSHPVAATVLQFRSFVIAAHSKQMLHAIHMWDRESLSTFLATMFAGQITHVAQTVANAPSLSEKQLEDRLSIKGIALGGLQRTGVTALLPLMADTVARMTGNPGLFNSRTTDQPSELLFGNPTIGLYNDIPNAINAIVQPLAQGRQVSRQEMKAMLRPLIWQNTLPITTLFGVMSQGRPETARSPAH